MHHILNKAGEVIFEYERSLAEAGLRGRDFRDAVFPRLDLKGLDFTEANLERALFDCCALSNASFTRCRMEGAHFENIRVEDDDSVVRDCSLAGARFQGAIMTSVHLSGADLRGADLSDVTADVCLMMDANLTGAILTRACFYWALLHDSCFDGANMEEAQLQCHMHGVTFRGANLRSANFGPDGLGSNTILINGDLSHADLRGACLRGARLTDCDFTGAFYDRTTQLDEAFRPSAHGMIMRPD